MSKWSVVTSFITLKVFLCEFKFIFLHPLHRSLAFPPVSLTLRRTESLSLQAAGSTVLIGWTWLLVGPGRLRHHSNSPWPLPPSAFAASPFTLHSHIWSSGNILSTGKPVPMQRLYGWSIVLNTVFNVSKGCPARPTPALIAGLEEMTACRESLS